MERKVKITIERVDPRLPETVYSVVDALLLREAAYVERSIDRLSILAPTNGTFNCFVPLELPSDLAIYSVKSLNETQQTIFAMEDCYVDSLATSQNLRAGELVFRLNASAIDRETFKLEQQQALSQITALRLEQNYLDSLILRPLSAAIDLATSDLAASQDELHIVVANMRAGTMTTLDVNQAEARVSERKINLLRATIDRDQRQMEIDSQRRKLLAETADLEERIELNQKIMGIHTFLMPYDGAVEYHCYEGCFTEKGDPICTVHG